jgi:rSAM/selenodomain-associated transferase 1
MTSDNGCVIAVFAKAALPGAVKTRLIPQIGADGAARLHLALVRQALQTALAAQIGCVQLWSTAGDSALIDIATTLDVDLRLQAGGDLGQRMSHTFAELLARLPSAIVVGSDCPSRCAQDFRDASVQLASGCDAVLGPTEDGGYHLIALNRMMPSVFTEIDWSTPAVLEQTRARLRALRVRRHELPLRWDVDRAEDLARLRADPRYAMLAAEADGTLA